MLVCIMYIDYKFIIGVGNHGYLDLCSIIEVTNKYFLSKGDTSMSKEPVDFSKVTKREFPLVKDLDYEQQDMVIKLFKNKRVIVDSTAGSGKTTILTQAMNLLKEKGHIDKIYYIVFPVEEDSLGYLPGGLGQKIKEYAVPFFQALTTAGINTTGLNIEIMCDEFSTCDYKVLPHTFVRGRTIEKAGVILDEAQNGTVDQLQKVLTRIADDCYVGIAGHNKQQDIKDSGFSRYIQHFKEGKATGIYTEIEFAELTHNYRGKFSSFSDQIIK